VVNILAWEQRWTGKLGHGQWNGGVALRRIATANEGTIENVAMSSTYLPRRQIEVCDCLTADLLQEFSQAVWLNFNLTFIALRAM
jgi:hypothetical protein